MISLFHVVVSPESKSYAQEVLDSGLISEGIWTERFEKALADELGIVEKNAYPVTTNSGTSALHLALKVVGVGKDDEVILPANTFVATGEAILYCGATPVFADINPRTGTLDPTSVASKITERTKVILPVHYAGYVCDLNALNVISLEHQSLFIIDDAAQAFGAIYEGMPIGNGQTTDATCFSFQATKHLNVGGDGGAVSFCFEEDAESARNLRWFDINRKCDVVSELGEREYSLRRIGFKYHLANLPSAIGLGNLVSFGDRLAQRHINATLYENRLQDVKGLELLEYPSNSLPAYYAFGIRCENRLGLVRKLREHGIESSILHSRIDRHSVFGKGIVEDLVGQAEFEALKLFLPVHEGLSRDEIEMVCDVIKGGW